MFETVLKEAHELKTKDRFRMLGQYAYVYDVRFIDEWIVVEFKLADSVCTSTVVIPNSLAIEILVRQ